MTSWLWMKGKPAIADPIPPVNEYDDRPSVKALIEEHREKINKTKVELKKNELYDANKHDDLWILRFLMSHKFKSKKAIKAAEHTLAFRKEHKLDDKDIRASSPGKNAPNESMQRYFKYCKDDAARFVVPDPQRGVIVFLTIASIDQHALVEHVSEDDWLPAFMYMSEWSFQWLDYITRTTGRLTKSIRLADTEGISLGGISRENNRRDGHVMGVMEDCYPQLLHTIYICHCPAWVQVPWRILRPIMPKRVTEKIDFIYPDTNEHEKERLLKHISIDHLPKRFGGTYEVWPVDFVTPKIE